MARIARPARLKYAHNSRCNSDDIQPGECAWHKDLACLILVTPVGASTRTRKPRKFRRLALVHVGFSSKDEAFWWKTSNLKDTPFEIGHMTEFISAQRMGEILKSRGLTLSPPEGHMLDG